MTFLLEMVMNGINLMLDMVKQVFPDTPILPTIGNHDNYLSDQLPPWPRSRSWLKFLASAWKDYLNGAALETVEYGAYYSQIIRPGLRLISFNSIYCDTSNLWAILNQTDHANQFVWLKQTLQNARDWNEKVFIAGHIVFTDYFPQCTKWYHQLAAEYSDVIVAHFFGDRHTDEFRLIRDLQDSSKIVGNLYVMPSINPHDNLNPSFRLYQFDPAQNYSIVEADTYYAPLGDGSQPQLIFQFEYSPKDAYNMSDLSPESWYQVYKRMASDSKVMDVYVSHFWNNHEMPCDTDCRQGMLYDVSTEISHPKLQSRIVGNNTELCIICKVATEIIDYLLSNGASDQLIMAELTTLCPYIHQYPENVCLGFIYLYGPESLPVFAIEGNPQRICGKDGLGFCPQ